MFVVKNLSTQFNLIKNQQWNRQTSSEYFLDLMSFYSICSISSCKLYFFLKQTNKNLPSLSHLSPGGLEESKLTFTEQYLPLVLFTIKKKKPLTGPSSAWFRAWTRSPMRAWSTISTVLWPCAGMSVDCPRGKMVVRKLSGYAARHGQGRAGWCSHRTITLDRTVQ